MLTQPFCVFNTPFYGIPRHALRDKLKQYVFCMKCLFCLPAVLVHQDRLIDCGSARQGLRKPLPELRIQRKLEGTRSHGERPNYALQNARCRAEAQTASQRLRSVLLASRILTR